MHLKPNRMLIRKDMEYLTCLYKFGKRTFEKLLPKGFQTQSYTF